MSINKKNELNSLINEIYNASFESLNAKKQGNQDSLEYFETKVDIKQQDLFNLMGGSMHKDFQTNVKSLLDTKGCDEENLDISYTESNYVHLENCLVLGKEISLQVIDEMFK